MYFVENKIKMHKVLPGASPEFRFGGTFSKNLLNGDF